MELSRALGAFRADLVARGIEQRVSTLVFSEFGRRVAENGSAGTDHGAGGLMMAMGSGVRGGLASEWPGCRPQDSSRQQPGPGNLKVPTDYRSVYRASSRSGSATIPRPARRWGDRSLVRGDGLAGRKLFE